MEDDTPTSEEEWQEMLKRKGTREVRNSREDFTVILNPPPELVRKLRKSSLLNMQQEAP